MKIVTRVHRALVRRLTQWMNPPIVDVGRLSLGRGSQVGDAAHIVADRMQIGDFVRIGRGAEIICDEVILGRGAIIEDETRIRCGRLIVGDGAVIRSGTRIDMVDLVIGDYTTINNNCYFGGTRWCRIGHNCWFGHFTVVDSIGTTRIGNGVCAGAHSQLWTHIYFGDVLQGCRFASHKPLIIEDDVWFGGHCIVAPIRAEKRSMALAGSVITHDMYENRTYAGVPALDMTDRIGTQFQDRTFEEKRTQLQAHLNDFLDNHRPRQNRIRIVDSIDVNDYEASQFSIRDRLYSKRGYEEEVLFMRYLLPTKAKFVPHPSADWIREYWNTDSA